ncbi:MAG: 2-hydroxyacyl-CoA dehydratase [Candidatus Lokiarchaeota archaeon]|nr:2-hydroxyacyl-CoA dehydratase [Candidatus Lokiarchaeota archaeon]
MKANVKPVEMLYEASQTTLGLIEGAVPKHEMQILKSFFRCMESNLRIKLEQIAEGKPIIGHHFAFPSEVFSCFDAVPICVEAISYLFSALFTTGSEKYYDLANSWGHPYHSCTSQKGMIGMALEHNFIDFDVIAIPSAPCDNTIASYQFFSEHLNIPTIVADMPYYHNSRGYEYYSNELESMIQELSTILNQEPNYERLRQSIIYSNHAVENLAEINNLRRSIPCPVESVFNPIGSAVQNFFSGQVEKEIFYNEVLEIARERVRTKKAWRETDERVRSFWPYMSVFFDITFCEWLDRKLGMPIVTDIFNYFFFGPIKNIESLDTKGMIDGLAYQSMEYPMVRQSESFASVFFEDAVNLAHQFSADCAIFTAHIGCKQSASMIQLMREILKEEVGIPMLTIEMDIGDKRMTSLETIKKKVLEFTQTLL